MKNVCSAGGLNMTEDNTSFLASTSTSTFSTTVSVTVSTIVSGWQAARNIAAMTVKINNTFIFYCSKSKRQSKSKSVRFYFNIKATTVEH